MLILRGLHDLASIRGGCVTIGNFDGVHLGHQAMLRRLLAMAADRKAPAVALTFDPAPAEVLRPHDAPPRLTTTAQKLVLFDALGLDAAVVCPCDQALLSLTADEFFERILVQALGARGVVEGPNFAYGRGRLGTNATLAASCAAAGIEFVELPWVALPLDDGAGGAVPVSSSRIRQLLDAGQVEAAARALGRCYRVEGVVVPGEARGRTLGFPTANVAGVETLLPGDGVYAGRAFVDEGPIPAALHLGPNPTFGQNQRKLEVHLLGYEGDLYGRRLGVEFISRVRGTMTFPDAAALVQQLHCDLAEVRRRAS